MNSENFVNYRQSRWLWITLVGLIVCTAIYFLNSPAGGRNGGTAVGYTFGILATVGIMWLMAYAARKRAYHSSLGTVEGWLAAHVWIGIGLLLLVPLHSGFSFGVNVHTLAYLLMVVTIVTGIWGVANYVTLSEKISAHRGGIKDAAILDQVESLSAQIEQLSAKKSQEFLEILNRFDFIFSPSFKSLLRLTAVPAVDPTIATTLLQHVSEQERGDAITMVGLLDQRSDIARRLIEQARIKALLKVWLYVHVPASVALCVALTVHILSVFFLW